MIGSIIWMVLVAMVIYRAMSQSKASQKSKERQRQSNAGEPGRKQPAGNAQQPNTYRSPQQPAGNAQQSNTYRQPNTYRSSKPGGEGGRTVTDADRVRLAEYRRKKAAAASPVQQTNRARHAAQPDIVERAKANSRKFAGRDETLEELEKEHRHSERVGSAVADIEDVSLLGPVEDLMVKGYDGNLSFERDFIGEAADMLAAFTLPE